MRPLRRCTAAAGALLVFFPCAVRSDCSGGPTPGTADVNVVPGGWASCAQSLGQPCKPACRRGYTSTALTPVCSQGNGSQFDASAFRCDPNACTLSTPLRIELADPHANYSDCNGKHTGQTCYPQCDRGYHPSQRGFELECVTVAVGDSGSVGVFDADRSLFSCAPNSCSGGPTGGGLKNVRSLSGCDNRTTGNLCNASDVDCRPGYVANGSFELMCVGDNGTGSYDAPLLCAESTCGENQYVRNFSCVDCPELMDSKPARAALGYSACSEKFSLSPRLWACGWLLMFGKLSQCDLLQMGARLSLGSEELPFLLHPIIPLELPLQHFFEERWTMVIVSSWVAVALLLLLREALYLGRSRKLRPFAHILAGVLVWLTFALLPGTNYSAARLIAERLNSDRYAEGREFTSQLIHNGTKGASVGEREHYMGWAIACIGVLHPFCFCLLLWRAVLCDANFAARFVAHDVGNRVRLLFGHHTWESYDVRGAFCTKWGAVFCMYKHRARWFMLCEVFITAVFSFGSGWALPVKRDDCVWRSRIFVLVCLGWFVLVCWLRPMRSAVGNVLVITVAFVQFGCWAALAVLDATDSREDFAIVDYSLTVASALHWAKVVLDATTIVYDALLADNADTLDVTDMPQHDLVTALARVHTEAATLAPTGFYASVSDVTGSCAPPNRQADGIEDTPLGKETPQELWAMAQKWSDYAVPERDVRKTLSRPRMRRSRSRVAESTSQLGRRATSQLTGGQPGGSEPERVTATDLLKWLERLPRAWAETCEDLFARHKVIERRRFVAHDVVCGAQHVPRQKAGKKTKVCCITWNLRKAVRRVLAEVCNSCNILSGDWNEEVLRKVKAKWLLPLFAIDPRYVSMGIVAVMVYSYEILEPGTNGQSKDLQIYAVMNLAMRELGDPVSGKKLAHKARVRHRFVLRLFLPLITGLEQFFGAMPTQAGMVFRGISVRVAQRFETGTHFLWSGFSSTSGTSTVARSFMSGSGTLFIIAQRRGVDVSWASVFPGENELLLPSNSVLTVMSKLSDSTLTLLGTNSDVLVVMENVNLMQRLYPQEAVDLALLAVVESSFIYEEFAMRYVEPQVKRTAQDDAAPKLYSEFQRFVSSDRSVLLLTGGGGTGKTSASLSLAAELLLRQRDRRMPRSATTEQARTLLQVRGAPGRVPGARGFAWKALPDGVCKRSAHLKVVHECEQERRAFSREQTLPIFVHLPWAADLLHGRRSRAAQQGEEAALLEHIRNQMHLDQSDETTRFPGAELLELMQRPLIIFLDSVDELAGDPTIMLRRGQSLLERGGIRLQDWPRAKFVVTCRDEYIEQHRLTGKKGNPLAWVTPDPESAVQVQMLPLNVTAVREYVRQAMQMEARDAARALYKAADGDLSTAPDWLRRTPELRQGLKSVQRAMHGHSKRSMSVATLRNFRWARAHGGGVVAKTKMGALMTLIKLEARPEWLPEGCFVISIAGARVSSAQHVQRVLAELENDMEVDIVLVHPSSDAAAAMETPRVQEAVRVFVQVLCRHTNTILRRFNRAAQGLTCIPFVLYMIVCAAPELAKLPPDFASSEPRCQVYELWIRRNIRERLPRHAALNAIDDPGAREELVVTAAMRLACRMFTGARWHWTVGGALDHLAGMDTRQRSEAPDTRVAFRKAVLLSMPLRVENCDKPDTPLSWRHRTLMEYLVARALTQDWPLGNRAVLGAAHLTEAPEVIKFIQERISNAAQPSLYSTSAGYGVELISLIEEVAWTKPAERSQKQRVSNACALLWYLRAVTPLVCLAGVAAVTAVVQLLVADTASVTRRRRYTLSGSDPGPTGELFEIDMVLRWRPAPPASQADDSVLVSHYAINCGVDSADARGLRLQVRVCDSSGRPVSLTSQAAAPAGGAIPIEHSAEVWSPFEQPHYDRDKMQVFTKVSRAPETGEEEKGKKRAGWDVYHPIIHPDDSRYDASRDTGAGDPFFAQTVRVELGRLPAVAAQIDIDVACDSADAVAVSAVVAEVERDEAIAELRFPLARTSQPQRLATLRREDRQWSLRLVEQRARGPPRAFKEADVSFHGFLPVLRVTNSKVSTVNGKYCPSKEIHGGKGVWRAVDTAKPRVLFFSTVKQRWFISDKFEDVGFVQSMLDSEIGDNAPATREGCPPRLWSRGTEVGISPLPWHVQLRCPRRDGPRGGVAAGGWSRWPSLAGTYRLQSGLIRGMPHWKRRDGGWLAADTKQTKWMFSETEEHFRSGHGWIVSAADHGGPPAERADMPTHVTLWSYSDEEGWQWYADPAIQTTDIEDALHCAGLAFAVELRSAELGDIKNMGRRARALRAEQEGHERRLAHLRQLQIQMGMALDSGDYDAGQRMSDELDVEPDWEEKLEGRLRALRAQLLELGRAKEVACTRHNVGLSIDEALAEEATQRRIAAVARELRAEAVNRALYLFLERDSAGWPLLRSSLGKLTPEHILGAQRCLSPELRRAVGDALQLADRESPLAQAVSAAVPDWPLGTGGDHYLPEERQTACAGALVVLTLTAADHHPLGSPGVPPSERDSKCSTPRLPPVPQHDSFAARPRVLVLCEQSDDGESLSLGTPAAPPRVTFQDPPTGSVRARFAKFMQGTSPSPLEEPLLGKAPLPHPPRRRRGGPGAPAGAVRPETLSGHELLRQYANSSPDLAALARKPPAEPPIPLGRDRATTLDAASSPPPVRAPGTRAAPSPPGTPRQQMLEPPSFRPPQQQQQQQPPRQGAAAAAPPPFDAYSGPPPVNARHPPVKDGLYAGGWRERAREARDTEELQMGRYAQRAKEKAMKYSTYSPPEPPEPAPSQKLPSSQLSWLAQKQGRTPAPPARRQPAEERSGTPPAALPLPALGPLRGAPLAVARSVL